MVIGPNLPLLVEEDVHRHGVTVSQRSKSAASCRSVPQSDKPDGELNLPKTYITRKGALMLFTASEDYHQLSEHDKLYLKQAQKLLKHRCKEYSNKLGSLSRLAQSVLTFGDEDYEKDEASISDKDSKMFLKFPRGLDTQGVDLHTQPGGDLSFYLQDLQSHASPGRTISRMLSAAKRSTPDISSQSGGSGRESAGLLSADHTDRLVGQLSRPASRATSGRSSSRIARSALGASRSRPRSSLKSAGTPSPHSAMLETASPPYNMSRPPSPSTRPSTAPATRPGSSRYRSRPSSMSSLSKFGKPASSISASGSSIDSHNAPLPKAANDSSASTVPHVTQAWGTSSTSSSDPSTQPDGVEIQRDHNVSPQREQTIIIEEDREGEEEEEEEDEEAQRMAQHIGVYLGRHTPVKMDLAAGKPDSPSNEQMMEEEEANSSRQEQKLSQGVNNLQELMSQDEEDADKAGDEGDREGVTEPLMPMYKLGEQQPPAQESLESRDEMVSHDEMVSDAGAEGADADLIKEGQEPSERSRSEDWQLSTDGGGEESRGEGGEDFLDDDLNPKLITVEMKSRHSSVASSNFDPALVAQSGPESTSQESKEQGAVVSDEEPTTGSVPDGDGLPGDTGATEVTESTRSSPAPDKHMTQGDFVISDVDPRPIRVEPETDCSSADSFHGDVLGARDDFPVDQGDIEGQGDSTSHPSLTPDPVKMTSETLKEGSEVKDTLGDSGMDGKTGEGEENDKENENTASSEQSASPPSSEDTPPAQPTTSVPPTATTTTASTPQLPKAPPPEQLTKSDDTSSSTKDVPAETKAKDAKSTKKSSASPSKKEYVKALNISSKQPPPAAPKEKQKSTVRAQSPAKSSAKPKPEKKLDLQAELAELMAASPGKPKEEPAKKPKVVLKPPSPPPVPKKSKEEVKLEKLEQEVTELFGKEDNGDDGGSTGEAGLTAEEMEIEQQLLKEKVQAAENLLKEEEAAAKKSKTKKKGSPAKHSKKVKKEKPEEKRDLAKEREALREARRLEQQRRIEEAKQLEQKIKEKEEEKSRQERDADIRKKEIEQELHAIRAEEEEAQDMEEEAREMMAAARRAAREEREAKRKAEQEKKKMETQKKREKEKQMMEAAREKEKAMLLQIASAEEKRKMMEEERSRKEEEEALERERQEEEETRLKLAAEEEEERIREMERQAEEEAIARLVRDKEEAETRRRQLQKEAERIREEEEQRRRALDLERGRLEEERKQREEREARRKAEEEQRKLEFLRQKEEAAEKMREEMAQRRELLLRRRDQNLERRSQLRSMKHGQGMTKPWVFTYYVNWPRETYERKIGGDDKKKRGFRPKPKPKPKSA